MSQPDDAFENAPDLLGLNFSKLTLECLVAKIKEAHGRSTTAAVLRNQYGRQSVEWALAAGTYLKHIKEEKLYGQHGDWEQWMEKTFKGQPKARQLQKYMRLALLWPQIEAKAKTHPNADFAILTIDQALHLVATPTATTNGEEDVQPESGGENRPDDVVDTDDNAGNEDESEAECEEEEKGKAPNTLKASKDHHEPTPRKTTPLLRAVAIRNALEILLDDLVGGEADSDEEMPNVLNEIIEYAEGAKHIYEHDSDQHNTSL